MIKPSLKTSALITSLALNGYIEATDETVLGTGNSQKSVLPLPTHPLMVQLR